MAVGVSTANLAHKWLTVLSGTTFTAPSTVYVKLHTGDPGPAGTANASAETTRKALSWAAPSGGVINLSASASWVGWTAGSETLSHVSVWDASSAGNCLFTAALATSKPVANGDTFNLTGLTLTVTPLMA